MPDRSLEPLHSLITDPDRLAALHAFDVLDTPREESFDDLAELAALACDTPVALVSFVTDDRQWFKARINFPQCETDLDRSVCKLALVEQDVFVIPDLADDERTAANPLVTGEPHIRFYAGVPLTTPEGQTLGSLCVIDTEPRPEGLSSAQVEHLRRCGRQVMRLLDMRRAVARRDEVLARQDAELRRERRLAVLAEASASLINATDPGQSIEPILARHAEDLGFEQCFIYDVAEDGHHLGLRQSVGTNDAVRDMLAHVHLDGPLCGIVVQTRAPFVLTHVLSTIEARYALARESGIDAFAGYPIEGRGRITGVISFTSSAQPSFDNDALAFFATIARYLSAMQERIDTDRALRASEARYRAIFENIDAGFCISEVKFDEAGRPIDHRVVAANPAFERHTGLSNAVGRWATDVAPGIEQHWHDAYGRVARTGEPIRFEGEAKPLGRWYDAHLFPVANGRVAMLIADTTERRAAQDALARGEAKWRTIFETLREGFILGELVRDEGGNVVDWRYEEVNNAWYDLVGIERGTAIGRTIREVFPGIEDAWVLEFAEVVGRSEPIRFTRQVGTLGRWYDGIAQHAGGDHFTVIFTEVTERVLRERRQAAMVEVTDRLFEQTTIDDMRFATSAVLGEVLDVQLVGYGDVDPQAETVTVGHSWTAGETPMPEGTLGFRDFGSYIDDLKAGRTVVVRDCRTDPRTREHASALEARNARALVNIPVFERGAFVALLYVCAGTARDWSGDEVQFIRDVAYRLRLTIERLRAEQQQAVLNGELAHRVKNTLSVVQAIANSTLARDADPAAATEFGNRLKALSSAHDVLLARSWAAAGFRQVADAALATFGGTRIELVGPDLKIGSRAAMSLSLLLHELATNASKYGALSVPEGRVGLSWAVRRDGDRDLLEVIWAERGGPPATEPTRRGFGSRIIRMGLTGSGGVKLSYDMQGLTAEMTAPLHQVEQA